LNNNKSNNLRKTFIFTIRHLKFERFYGCSNFSTVKMFSTKIVFEMTYNDPKLVNKFLQ